MAPAKKSPRPCCHVSFLLLQLVLLSVIVFPATAAAASTFRCSNPSPVPNEVPEGNDARELLRSFQITTGYFSGGDRLFAPDDDSAYIPRSFALSPYKVARTTDPAILEVAATLALYGPSSDHGGGGGARRRRHRYLVSQLVASFVLHGYYSSASGELCVVGGSGSYSVDGGSVEHLRDVNLHLRVPNAPSLADPFVTGLLDGADFETISLVAYVENDRYVYSEKRPSCPPPMPAHAVRGALQALEANFSCSHLRELFVSSYRLENTSSDASSPAASTFQFPLSHGGLRMLVNQMHCTANGSVRAYVVFSNYTDLERRWRRDMVINNRFLVKEEAVVADGYWDATTSRLCLSACRVAHSSAAETELKVGEQCGLGMSFWFPAVWTIRDRSIVAGLLWNANQEESGGNKHAGASLSGVMLVSSIDGDGYNRRRSNLTDVKYNYTMVEKAKKQYLSCKFSKRKTGRFPGNSSMYSYSDFRFDFIETLGAGGQASPVTIGSVMVDGDQLAAEYMFFRHAMGEMNKSRTTVVRMDHSQLLNVSYDISYRVRSANSKARKNSSSLFSHPLSIERREISAEGVYDPKTGILFMVGCQEINGSSTDCQILVTVHFASLDAKGNGHGRGKISSTRDKADRLHFEAMDITLYGMYREQIGESIWRMDLEIIMAVVSATLSCVFAALQIRHARANPASALSATSVAMLAVLALGHVTHLALNVDALFVSRRTHYIPISADGWLELNEVMLRVPTLIAFALHLCLLQLVWSSRRSAPRAIAEKWSAAERRSLWICLPLYLLGGLLAGAVHVINNGRAAAENSLVVRVAGDSGTLWDDLASYAGLVLDGFLLPQVILNALSRSRARAISAWFYVGVTVLRAAPHVYDALRARGYVPSVKPSSTYVYASPRDDLFGVAWDVAVPLGAASLALLLFLQQRLGGAFFVRGRRFGEYEMVPTTVSSHQEGDKKMDHERGML
uniref:RING-type E3 ubiquitin transferase n=1 Tax=Oryza meridionalis TaxID=40149 RepID=A0A0E0C616_9ORYZ